MRLQGLKVGVGCLAYGRFTLRNSLNSIKSSRLMLSVIKERLNFASPGSWPAAEFSVNLNTSFLIRTQRELSRPFLKLSFSRSQQPRRLMLLLGALALIEAVKLQILFVVKKYGFSN